VEHGPDAPSPPPLRLAFLISGGGSTLANVLRCIAEGLLNARVVGVAASRDCAGLEHARAANIPFAVVPRGEQFNEVDFSRRLTRQLDAWRPELIVMGGFLTLYLIPAHYQRRVINIHPALLPDFGGRGMYGARVHEAVLASGAKHSGASVHFVDNEYDHGPLIAQRSVDVQPGDTPESLGERVRAVECELLPLVIGWFAAGRVQLDGEGKVTILPPGDAHKQ
jgi:formyltetrahydrofolate-dependent phosphoribosylglycinamide formyltransferase